MTMTTTITVAQRSTTMVPSLFIFLTRLSPLLLLSWSAESFSPPPTTLTRRANAVIDVASTTTRAGTTSLSLSSEALPIPMEAEDDDDMEWVEEEFELLTERDFYNTEWKIGTLMENKPREAKSIATTWVRLVTNDQGENKAIWGDDSKGKWTIDVPSQFFSISKETFGGWFGKQIWAGTIEDFYYLEGTVRGWNPIAPATVVGQWQGVRLGVVEGDRVSVEERGVAPWFMEEDEDDEESSEDNGEEKSAIAAADAENEGDVQADDENEGDVQA